MIVSNNSSLDGPQLAEKYHQNRIVSVNKFVEAKRLFPQTDTLQMRHTQPLDVLQQPNQTL